MYCTGHRTPSSYAPRNCHSCICLHEFRDIHLLVEQTSQYQWFGLFECSEKSEPREAQSWVSESISEAQKLTWEALGNGFVKTLGFIIRLQDYGVDLSREDRVPRFGVNATDDEGVGIADAIMLGVGVSFGAIHCIAWYFSFLMHTELLMWRISSVAVTAVPFYISLTFILVALLEKLNYEKLYWSVQENSK